MSGSSVIPIERIEQRIFLLRGQKVMLSPHLAELYGVEPKVLIQAVKRNLERFPDDFMFQLAPQEVALLSPDFPDSLHKSMVVTYNGAA